MENIRRIQIERRVRADCGVEVGRVGTARAATKEVIENRHLSFLSHVVLRGHTPPASMCVTGICFWQHRADFVRRVILCWRQYGIGTKPGFLAIENWAGEARESRHSMVVSNAVHRARLLKADPYPTTLKAPPR
jgi:hypothetical protein